MNPISVCIIAKNEEAHIERLLKSLQPFPFEIVLVDTGSCDRTREIASGYTSSIYDYAWNNNFSDARNFSLQKAANDWIFIMDSDEWVETLNLSELYYFQKNLSSSVGSVTRNNITGTPEHPGATIDYTERFFNRKLYHYTGRIHEQLTPKSGTSFETLLLNTAIGHDGYLMTEEQRLQKANRNISLLLEELKETPDNPYLLYQLGKGYEMISDSKTACQYYHAALTHELDVSLAYVQSLVLSYGELLAKTDSVSAFTFLQKYNGVLSDNADYLYLLGCICYQNKNYEKALALQETALTCPIGKKSGTNSFLPRYEIGKILCLISEWQLARKYFMQCGNYPPALQALQVLDEESL